VICSQKRTFADCDSLLSSADRTALRLRRIGLYRMEDVVGGKSGSDSGAFLPGPVSAVEPHGRLDGGLAESGK
jgi:hypothetical protein